MNSKIEDEQAIVMQLQKKIKELQVNYFSFIELVIVYNLLINSESEQLT